MEQEKPKIINSLEPRTGEYVDDEEDEYYIRGADGKTKQVTKEEYEEFIKKQKEENDKKKNISVAI